ncbi:MAG: hypothetical protein ACTSUE_14600 [Promethearchaeota archaeon]
MAEELEHKFENIKFPAFFKVWYHIQKELSDDVKKSVLTKVGRAIGRELNTDNVETVDDFLVAMKKFLEEEWAMTDTATLEKVEDADGVVKIKCHMDSCKMCFANSYYKKKDGGSPVCMFPQVMMGALGKVKNKFKFRNLAYDCVDKPGPVGECIMTWNVK